MTSAITTTAEEISDAFAPPAPTLSESPEIVIRPRRGWIRLDWAEMWEYRELLFFLVWRDIKARYKQTVFGFAWAVVQPVADMIIFTIIFGRLVKVPSDNLPYPVFVYAGILPWTFFAAGLTQSGASLVNARNMLTKVYFPRLFIPLAAVLRGLVELLISAGVYACILIAYGITPSWGVVYVPLLVILTAMAALGLGFLLSALTVSYRDFAAIVPFTVRAMMYLTPVVFPVSLVPSRYQWLLAVNPMAGIIDAFRSAILGRPWNLTTLTVSIGVTVALFLFGLFYFRRTERRFADVA